MLSFNKNVYLVYGAKKDCIYNLNTGEYFQIYKSDTNKIKNLLLDNQCYGGNDSFLDRCFEKEILVDVSESEFSDGEIENIQIGKNNIEFAWIEVTTKCNLYCKHCYEESSSECNSSLDYDSAKYILDELFENKISKIQFIGGEPLLIGDNLKKMIEYAKDKFEYIEVFTNGTLLNEEWANFFKENNIKVALSLYSYNAYFHDSVTKIKGSFNKTTNAIRILKEKGIPYKIATVHMDGCILGVKRDDLFTLNPSRDIVRMSGRAEVNLLNRELLEKKLITEQNFKNKVFSTMFINGLKYHKCFSKKIYISANLDIFPCVMERRISHGNLYGKRLKDVLNQEIYFMNKDKIDVCKDCELRYACYDCRADSISKNVYAQPWYCTYNPYESTWKNKEEFIDDMLGNTCYKLMLNLDSLIGYTLLDCVEVLEKEDFKIDKIICEKETENPFVKDQYSQAYSKKAVNAFKDKKVNKVEIVNEKYVIYIDLPLVMNE